MGLSLLEKSILIAGERSNGVVSCNGGGMELFTGGSGAAAEGPPSGWESMGWSCNGCKGASTQELCTCRKISRNVIVVLQEYTSFVEFVGSLSAISTSVVCDVFQSKFTNEGIMVEIAGGLDGWMVGYFIFFISIVWYELSGTRLQF
jgi:hypothetical protein